MRTANEILPNIIGGIAVLLLAFIGRSMLGIRRDFRHFMAEHAWLIATSLWTRDKVMLIMTQLGMPIGHDDEPPSDLPWRHRG